MTLKHEDRWQQIKTVFTDALDRGEEERAAFVEQACAGDAELRDEVASLLASARAAASFAETPAAALLLPADARQTVEVRLPPGTRLGAYEVTEFISAGGMGVVYRARHAVLGRTVAIKTVNALADEAAGRRLIREARHASVLRHPNVCTIHEVGESDGRPFIVMEFVDGVSLHERLSRAPPPLDEALDIGTQVAAALEHAHGHGIVHRDLKSANVVVDGTGRAIVLDFGLARRIARHAGEPLSESTLTIGGALAGTLSHMAPELLRGDDADARSDVWSLGVMLYELVTGRLPFAGRTSFETTSSILDAPPAPMSRGVPLALRLVIERCLAKNPAARYQSAADVGDALTRIRRRHAWPLVGRLVIRALQIDPLSAEAHAALGYVRHYEWRWAESEQEFRRAIQLNPSYPFAHLWYANLLMSRWRFDEALRQSYAARDLDPYSLIINTNIAWVLIEKGQFAQGIAQLRLTLSLDSTYLQAHMRLIEPLAVTGQGEEARREAAYVYARTGGAPSALAGLARLDALQGRTGDARRGLAQLLARARTEYVSPGAIAIVYSALGDTAGQDLWLERAADEHSNITAYLATERQTWLRDSVYTALLARAGLREQP